MDKYLKILQKHDIKVTHSRLAILKYLHQHKNHPTVDKVYMDIKDANPSLSKTTVYNTVEILEKEGLLKIETFSDNEKHLDIKTSVHHHFICRYCERILDIDISCPNIGKVVGSGHKVEDVHGYFYGVCKDCLEKEEGSKLK